MILYILVYPVVGSAPRAATSPLHVSVSATGVQERCELAFFHDSQHFGFGSSYRLSVTPVKTLCTKAGVCIGLVKGYVNNHSGRGHIQRVD